MRAPPDALRHGFRKASEDVRPVHPVQLLENHVSLKQRFYVAQDYFSLRVVIGSTIKMLGKPK